MSKRMIAISSAGTCSLQEPALVLLSWIHFAEKPRGSKMTREGQARTAWRHGNGLPGDGPQVCAGACSSELGPLTQEVQDQLADGLWVSPDCKMRQRFKALIPAPRPIFSTMINLLRWPCVSCHQLPHKPPILLLAIGPD